ncbi:hypothetical protein AWC03_23910 [Mycobacterium europaeum]|uniref:DUF732 domain-containing protein n=1 Tax=Mycobacterium europaeum TaxID=761804 RepID=UPI000A152735|nr:DUF732 domain-containing protein [Mycobacterium europaeum]ORV50652.1 hypothetical protein AWC03_23910 [Mycobacterium europaeum]
MRDRETIDAELRRIAARRRSVRERGGRLSSQEVDELLDELLAHNTGVSFSNSVEAPEAGVRADNRSPGGRTGRGARRAKRPLLRRGLSAAMPLSLVAVAAALVVVVFTVHRQDPSAQRTEAPTETAPSAGPPSPRMAPKAPAPRVDIADTAFITALKHQGIPVPSQDYVMAQGHAVCDFLARRPNFADAVQFVQRSSVWDADQSAQVTAGAIVSYCPQSQPTAADQMQPAYQNTLSDLQAIQRQLDGIQGDLQGIQGSLDGIPGHP